LILRLFIEKGAALPGTETIEKFGSPLVVAITNRQLSSSEIFLSSESFSDLKVYGGTYHSALQAAARWMRTLVPRLLSLGADVNATGGALGTALHAAAYTHDWENILLLLKHGADPTVIAGKYGGVLQAAAKENATVNGSFQASRASVNAMKLLHKHGAQVNATGGKYHTALQMAAKSGNLEGVRWLLDNGADPRVEGGKFGTILQAAARKKQPRYGIISYLEQHVFKDEGANLDFDSDDD